MAVLELPCRTDLTHYSFFAVLDAVTYELEFRWNIRDEAWYLDLKLDDGTNIMNGVKVVIDWPLMRSLKTAERPLGEFIAVDSSGAKEDPTIDSLGARHKFYYFDADSLTSMIASL